MEWLYWILINAKGKQEVASDLPSPWPSAEGWAGTWTYQMQCVSVWLRDTVPLWLYHSRVHAWETLNALISGEQVLWTPTLERVSWATPDALCESLVSVPAAGERPGFQSQPTPWLADQAEPKRPCPEILCVSVADTRCPLRGEA